MIEYADRIEELALRYEERALTILQRIRTVLLAHGYDSVPPYRMFDDNYRWAFATKNADGHVGDGSVDFTLEIVEQRDYDGEDAEPGINVGLNIVEYGGRIIGGWQPYNFTDNVWVDAYNDAAVEERFAFFETGDVDQVPELLLSAGIEPS